MTSICPQPALTKMAPPTVQGEVAALLTALTPASAKSLIWLLSVSLHSNENSQFWPALFPDASHPGT